MNRTATDRYTAYARKGYAGCTGDACKAGFPAHGSMTCYPQYLSLSVPPESGEVIDEFDAWFRSVNS